MPPNVYRLSYGHLYVKLVVCTVAVGQLGALDISLTIKDKVWFSIEKDSCLEQRAEHSRQWHAKIASVGL